MDCFHSKRLSVIEKSIRAPGLPFLTEQWEGSNVKSLVITSVNYDYTSISLESPRTLWVSVKGWVPSDLMVGTQIKLKLTPSDPINFPTELNVENTNNSTFQVDDIIGNKIVLLPYVGSAWLPTTHSSCEYPKSWGYSTRRMSVRPSLQTGTAYGYGISPSTLEYHPSY